MPRNDSIRRLHLPTNHLLAAETSQFGAVFQERFEHLYRTHPYVLKVRLRDATAASNLVNAAASQKIPVLAAGADRLYLFATRDGFAQWSRQQTYLSETEEVFLRQLRLFLEREARRTFEMVSDRYHFGFGGPTRLMGILNVTPDSFYDGGRYADKNAAVDRGFQMEEEGADIIDIGGESTRPGAAPVSAEQEIARIIPVIETLAAEIKIPVSVDTYKAQVAEAAIQAGATIVNDISGLQFDPHILEVVAHYGVPLVIMHIKGRPQDMQINPTYENLMDELYDFFEQSIARAEASGIDRSRIIIDPGLGFGKRLWDNYEILQRLQEFKGLGCPLLVGPSRKSFIGKILDLPAEERLEGTAAAVTTAVANGCQLVRVHDIKEMLRVVQIADLLCGNVVLDEQDILE